MASRQHTPQGENTDFPWYAITRKALCGRILLAGPFFCAGEAQEHLDTHRHLYGGHAVVWTYSGRHSPLFRAWCIAQK